MPKKKPEEDKKPQQLESWKAFAKLMRKKGIRLRDEASWMPWWDVYEAGVVEGMLIGVKETFSAILEASQTGRSSSGGLP